ncbi:MAG: non-heme iron oxygenase ferredoxin subunit [Arenicellales bacterium]
MPQEIYVCQTDDIDEEDVIRFDHNDQTYCVYHTTEGFFATDGFCTHEEQHLEDGIVIDNVIECPLHQGRFDIRSGKALSAPVCIDLKTYPIEVRDGAIYLFLNNETPQS